MPSCGAAPLRPQADCRDSGQVLRRSRQGRPLKLWTRRFDMAIILTRDGMEKGATVTYDKDARVDSYIDALPDWQQEICQQIRDLVHAADPEVVETIKRRVQPYFVLEGNICALLAAKDHVNVFLYDGAIRPRPGGHHHRRARQQVGQDGRVLAGRRNPTA